MVRDNSGLLSPVLSIEHISAKHAENDGIQVEESFKTTATKSTYRPHTTTDDESGFSETDHTISVRSSPMSSYVDDDYELASLLPDESKKEFCSNMCLIFHAEFELTFGRYFTNHRWVLMPLDTDGTCHMPPHTLCDVEIAKVRFECLSCEHCWTSMRGQISFFYDYVAHILYFKLFTQSCDRCGELCTPLWYPEEVCRVMKNVFLVVNQHLYPTIRTPIESNYHRRFGNPKGQHHGCESCQDGICVSVAAQQLGYKLVK